MDDIRDAIRDVMTRSAGDDIEIVLRPARSEPRPPGDGPEISEKLKAAQARGAAMRRAPVSYSLPRRSR